jgi:hypothetical protein
MDESKVVKVDKIIEPEITIGRPEGLGSDLEVRIDGKALVTIHYVYPWIDNSGQYAVAEKIAKMFKGEA